jgi:hypothetical protein
LIVVRKKFSKQFFIDFFIVDVDCIGESIELFENAGQEGMSEEFGEPLWLCLLDDIEEFE